MSLDDISLEQQSPLKENGDFIWPPNIRWQIQEILSINEWDFDEQFIELVRSKFPEAWKWFSKRSNGYTSKVFWIWRFIRLLEINNVLELDLIQLEWNWIQGMLEVLIFAIENNYKLIKGKVQPQKRSSPRRKKILYNFYSNFWFSWNDWTNISLDLSEENRKVLVNKVKYYLENWKWFKS